MFAPSHTILLITSQVSARIDLAGKRRAKVKQIWSLPSVGYEDPFTQRRASLEAWTTTGPLNGC